MKIYLCEVLINCPKRFQCSTYVYKISEICKKNIKSKIKVKRTRKKDRKRYYFLDLFVFIARMVKPKSPRTK